MKRYSTRAIKSKLSYSLAEVSEILNVHIRTVRSWVKQGLRIVDGCYPYLVMGFELIKFLETKKLKNKCKLQPDEFWCTKCRKARQSINNEVKLYYSGKTVGTNIKDFTIQGSCEICNTRINRFSNENYLHIVYQHFKVLEVIEV